MTSLSIADYLDHLRRVAGEKAPPRRERSPFRPRIPVNAQGGGLGSRPVFDRAARTIGGDETQGEGAPQHAPWARKPVAIESAAAPSPSADAPVRAEDLSATLDEAYARGREDGLAEGRIEASERHAAELAAVREQAETQRQAFHIDEYIELEGAIRCAFSQIEDAFGEAVTRILAPFLSQQVVKQTTDELREAIHRLSAGNPPGLIKIRGPERVLALLRERIADLAVEVEYVEEGGMEAVVEADAAQIVAELRPWAELLAAFEV